MADDQDEDAPKKGPPTQDEIEQYERDVRRLIRFRSAFDKHMQFLEDRLAEKERQAEKSGGGR